MRALINGLFEGLMSELQADALVLFRKQPTGWSSELQLGLYRGQMMAHRVFDGGMVTTALAAAGRPVVMGEVELPAELRADFARLAIHDAVALLLPVRSAVFVVTLHSVEQGHFTPARRELLVRLCAVVARALERLEAGSSFELSTTEESERRFRSFMAAVPANTWVKDRDGRYLFANERTMRMFQRGRTMLGQTDADVMPPAIAAKVRADDLRVLDGRETLLREEDIPTSDGRMHTWLTTKFPIVDAAGEVTTGGMAFDVTEQRAATREAAEAREQLATVLKLLHEPVLVYAGDEVVYANDAFWSLIGAAGPQPSFPVSALVPPEAQAGFRSRQEALRAGQPVEGRELISRLDGGKVLVEFSTSPSTFQGRAANVAVLRDITAQRAAEERLQLTERLASLGTLAAGVAHEINNPLTWVCTNLAMLVEALADEPELGALAAESLDGAERITRIVQGMRAFARPAGHGPRERVDLEPVLRRAVDFTSHLFRERAQLTLQLEGLAPVRGDETALLQVFVNLLANAAQAITPGAPRDNVVSVVGRVERGRVLLEVRDSGSGMTPEVMARIFDPFFTTKPVNVGTGLGLSICHGLIQGHQGQLRVESTVGKGSTFTVDLPAALDVGPPAVGTGRRLRILLVDDDPLARGSLERLLEHHDVVACGSGAEALTVLEMQTFDLVLCDVLMPGMTGPQCIAKAPAWVAERVVFITGGSAFGDDDGPAATAPVAFKPISRQALARVLAEAEQRLAADRA